MLEISLKSINNKIKSYINEASGISDKCKNKLIRLTEKHFLVKLPHENYKNIDIEILENGNVRMRDVEFQTSNPVSNFEELLNRFNEFESEVETLLEKKATNFDKKKNQGNISNLLILLLYGTISILVIIYSFKQLIYGDIMGLLYLAFILGYYIIPISGSRVRERIIKAKKYIKSLLNK